MKNKILIAFVVIAVLALSAIVLAKPQAPTGPDGSTQQPPTGMGQQPAGDDTQPLKNRLEELYSTKDSYIQQKRQCKEESAMTNAPSGTCWNKLKPLMIGLLQKEIKITARRLMQLKDKNITFSNIDEISAKLKAAEAIFADPSSSKELIKSTAKDLEELINDIEDEATKTQPKVLIAQMDALTAKADAVAKKLEAKLGKLKAAGVDTASLESDLAQFNADLAEANKKIADAKANYQKMGTSKEITQLAKEIRTTITDAQKSLQKAFDKAKAMIPNMGQGNAGANSQGQTSGENPSGNAPGQEVTQ